MQLHRQGDLLIQEIEAIPKKAKKSTNMVLLYGEVTGHKHLVQGGDVYRDGLAMFLNVKDKALIVHEEHKPISLRSGKYAILRQREYVSSDMVRVVVD